jgi:tetratricopeptide (TPR) repeat protein
MKQVSPYWFLILLATMCVTLATLFVPRAANWNGNLGSENALKLLLGDGRKLFANEFYAMGDVYFHSGYYPSIFDRHEDQPDVAVPAHGLKDEDSTSDDFLGPPKDWVDALGRNFKPNKHTHLSAGGPLGNMKSSSVEEILPWLKLAADMNPQMIENYTVAAYWLRTSLNKPQEAEAFLREGLHNNSDSYELLFNLGQIYNENYHDPVRARNIWEAALRRWQAQSDEAKKNIEDKRSGDEICINLARLEESTGNLPQAVKYLEISKTLSPDPKAIQQWIDRLKQKLVTQSTSTNAPPH